jgi:hypothetical protein
MIHALQERYDMDSMDNVRERFEALEQQMNVLRVQTRTAERRRRWWRGFACGMVILSLRGWGFQSSHAVLADHVEALQNDIAALQDMLWHMTNAANDREDPEVVISGANLRIINIANGGTNRSAPGTENWAAGPLFADN